MMTFFDLCCTVYHSTIIAAAPPLTHPLYTTHNVATSDCNPHTQTPALGNREPHATPMPNSSFRSQTEIMTPLPSSPTCSRCFGSGPAYISHR
jgi:hypothetical protein